MKTKLYEIDMGMGRRSIIVVALNYQAVVDEIAHLHPKAQAEVRGFAEIHRDHDVVVNEGV